MKSIETIAEEVVREVMRARQQWGVAFDMKNTLNDWCAYVNIYLGRATTMGANPSDVEKNLRKAAGLVLSALYHAENGALASRHYDGQERPMSLPDIKV